jgi:hypothetical protein
MYEVSGWEKEKVLSLRSSLAYLYIIPEIVNTIKYGLQYIMNNLHHMPGLEYMINKTLRRHDLLRRKKTNLTWAKPDLAKSDFSTYTLITKL